MAFCSNCGAELIEGANACTSCGTLVNEAVDTTPGYDHTAEFDQEDIDNNKIYAMCGYLFSVLGLAIIYLGAKDSPYAMFHAKQSLKLMVASTIAAVLTVLLCWTCIVLVAGTSFLCIVTVLECIAVVQVMEGKAKEPWLVRSMKFLGK